jgi:hypothetical protein
MAPNVCSSVTVSRRHRSPRSGGPRSVVWLRYADQLDARPVGAVAAGRSTRPAGAHHRAHARTTKVTGRGGS